MSTARSRPAARPSRARRDATQIRSAACPAGTARNKQSREENGTPDAERVDGKKWLHRGRPCPGPRTMVPNRRQHGTDARRPTESKSEPDHVGARDPRPAGAPVMAEFAVEETQPQHAEKCRPKTMIATRGGRCENMAPPLSVLG